MQTIETRERDAGGRRAAHRAADDLELVAHVRAGDTDAFGVLVERHWPAVHSAAARHCGNRTDAEDIAVATFMRTLASIVRGHGPTACVRSYLIATSARVASDRHRSRRVREVPLERAHEHIGDATAGLDAASGDGVAGDVALAFGRLPSRWQHILWESYVVGRPVREIAESMGLRPNTAAAIAYRARNGLRDAYLATLDEAQVVK